MNRYLKLVHWEITRFWKMLAVLALLTVVLQCAGIAREVHNFKSQVNDQVLTSHSTVTDYVEKYGKLTFVRSLTRMGLALYAPIALCAGVLALYIFLIWYKDWYGKNAFIYRLLMIPTARRNIYFAKLTAILLFVFALVGLQIVLLPLENKFYMAAGGSELFTPSGLFDIITANQFLALLIPATFTDFVLNYGIGTAFVLFCFTAVLLERSYKLKGIGAALLYGAAVGLFMLLPLFMPGHITVNYLTTTEFFFIEVALGLVAAAVTMWLGLRLITKKVTV